MPQPTGKIPVEPNPRRKPAAEPLRRRSALPDPPSPIRRKMVTALLVFVTVVLIVDALVGEKGLIETMRARQVARVESARLASLREENARLREQKRRLSEDPSTIEAEARQQLGLIRPGEVMFILKDIRTSEGPPAGASR
jgi:cell division protein FtsB